MNEDNMRKRKFFDRLARGKAGISSGPKRSRSPVKQEISLPDANALVRDFVPEFNKTCITPYGCQIESESYGWWLPMRCRHCGWSWRKAHENMKKARGDND